MQRLACTIPPVPVSTTPVHTMRQSLVFLLCTLVAGCALLGDQHVALQPAQGAQPQKWMLYVGRQGFLVEEDPSTPRTRVAGNGRRIVLAVRDQLPDRRIGSRLPEGWKPDPVGAQDVKHRVLLDPGAAEAFQRDLAQAAMARGFVPVEAGAPESDGEPLRLTVDLQRIAHASTYGMGSNLMRIEILATVDASHDAANLRREFSAICFGDLGFLDVLGGTLTEDRVAYALNAAAWELIGKILDDPELDAFLN
jgi:hypothetical protein